MITQFCLSLAPKLAPTYDDIWYDEKSGTGILILQAGVALGIIKTKLDQREVSTNALWINLKIKSKAFRIMRNFFKF